MFVRACTDSAGVLPWLQQPMSLFELFNIHIKMWLMYIFQLHYKGLCRAVNVEDDGYITLKYNYNNHDITVYNTLIKNTVHRHMEYR